MAKRVIWTPIAHKVFEEILEYYYQRNGNKTYSRKLNNEVKHIVSLLQRNPNIGIKANKKNTHSLIHKNYKIIYQTCKNFLVIHLVWDTRQEPEKLNKILRSLD